MALKTLLMFAVLTLNASATALSSEPVLHLRTVVSNDKLERHKPVMGDGMTNNP